LANYWDLFFVREYLSNIIGGYASFFVTIQCLSLVPWLCRGMQWVSISRSVALPRNAVGEAPPHEQPHGCHVPLCLSIRSKLCFGWRSHTIRVTWRSLVT